jgi:hypothetical protein
MHAFTRFSIHRGSSSINSTGEESLEHALARAAANSSGCSRRDEFNSFLSLLQEEREIEAHTGAVFGLCEIHFHGSSL